MTLRKSTFTDSPALTSLTLLIKIMPYMKKRRGNQEDRTKSASAKRRERERALLRKNILQAASQEFLEHGYEDFSLRRVAERIGYTPTTIYLYFRNKDDLLHSTVLE